jgi:polyisoprenoid-binding protein YceI
MALEKWEIDTARSAVGFTVRHMVVTKVHGRFTRWSGALELDLGNLTASSVHASLEAASIETRDALRDGYLRSAEFLNPEKHPTLEFRSTRIEGSGKKYKVRGGLTIRGVTREVVLDTVFGGQRTDGVLGPRIKFEATTKIDRRSFGLEWNAALEAGGFLVGDNVDITLDIEAKRLP